MGQTGDMNEEVPSDLLAPSDDAEMELVDPPVESPYSDEDEPIQEDFDE